MSWFRKLVAGILPRRPGFTTWLAHVGLVVKNVQCVRVCFQDPRFLLSLSLHQYNILTKSMIDDAT